MVVKGLKINMNLHVYFASHVHIHVHTHTLHVQRVSDPYERGGPSYLVVPPKQQSSIGSIRCECHVKVVDKTAKRAKIKLVLASIIALAFMAGEVVGKKCGLVRLERSTDINAHTYIHVQVVTVQRRLD